MTDASSGPTTCIIGAGASGIAVAQVLSARGLPFECFEMGSEVGGNWRYENDNGVSSAYRSLHINTSRQTMQYAAYPMPDSYPDYPSHWEIARYFDDYVDHFALREQITFRTEVTKVVPQPGGGFEVTTRTLQRGREPDVRHFDQVVVANGHHWDPRWPEPSFPGSETFPGEQMHAHYYRTPEPLAGKRVVVLGIGNSAADIAVESSRVADATYLAMRRGAHVIPKYIFGKPFDRLTDTPIARGPLRLQQAAMQALLRASVGRMSDYGMPEPDHKILEAHPTVSSDLLTRLGHGDLTVKPSIARFEGSTVHFTDDSAVEADVVIYCTGYKISFPFLDERVVAPSANHVSLYRRVVHLDHPGLFFVGLIQPVGSIMPLAEAQAHWVADLVQGRATLPSREEMRRQVAAYDEEVRRRYVASKRHTIQVDGTKYLAEIQRERRERRVP